MNKESREEIGLVLLHGAGLGAWVWDEVRERLAYPSIAVDFPGRGANVHTKNENLTLQQYVESVAASIENFSPKKIIIVAHSISGVLSLELAHLFQYRIAGFIAIGAAIPRERGSFLSSLPFPNRTILKAVLSLLGTKPPVSALQKGLCNDLDESKTMHVTSSFVPESKGLYTEKVRFRGRFPHSLYIRLTEDGQFSDRIQERMIANLVPDVVDELNSGHLPMLSHPEELAMILNNYTEKLETNMTLDEPARIAD